jgi:hypothetical protein
MSDEEISDNLGRVYSAFTRVKKKVFVVGSAGKLGRTGVMGKLLGYFRTKNLIFNFE